MVPSHVDLRVVPSLPIDVRRLRDSRLVASRKPEEVLAALILWCAAWHQVPAGSLPDNDEELANLAGYGRGIRDFRRVKAGALHGFKRCSDGRLYHPVLAEKAIAEWDALVHRSHISEKQRLKGHVGAAKRWGSQSHADNMAVATDVDSHSMARADGVAIKHISHKTPIPYDFTISEKVKKWSLERGYGDLELHLEAFRNKCYAKAYRYADWDRAFMEAIRGNWARIGSGQKGKQQALEERNAQVAKNWRPPT